MRVVATGTAGQFAKSFAERMAATAPDLELALLGRPGLDLEQLDSIAPALASAAPDVVINGAAYTAVDKAEDERERCFLVNGEAAARVAGAARDCGARLIQISTDYVFDGAAGRPYSEADPTNPINVYGASKLAGEAGVRAATDDHLIVRTAWVYGPHGGNFVKSMLRMARGSEPVRVVADQIGSPTAAFDLSDGLITVLRSWAGGGREGLGETMHLTGSGGASWFEFARHVFAEAARHGATPPPLTAITTPDYPTRAARPADTRLDCTRFADRFGFTSPDWRVSTAETVERLMGQGDA
jgi:dTDP-4-dehydrorhamnose reductase